jgi:hypothetical protein
MADEKFVFRPKQKLKKTKKKVLQPHDEPIGLTAPLPKIERQSDRIK